jgi:hypothetical protein
VPWPERDPAIHARCVIGSLSYPLSMMAVLTANPRALEASISGSANIVSASLAVSTVQASGSARDRTDGRVDPCNLRSAVTLPSAHGGAMAPRGVGVGELLALGSVLGQEPLTVGVSREIRPVDSDVAAHLGQALVQRGDTRSRQSASASESPRTSTPTSQWRASADGGSTPRRQFRRTR